MNKSKPRFDIKVSFIEGDRIQVTFFQGSDKGKPIAKGTIERLDEASRSAFVDMIRQLDGGRIVQSSQSDS